MPPIEGGQSLAEAEPIPKRGPFFSGGLETFWKENAGLLFQVGHYLSRRLSWKD